MRGRWLAGEPWVDEDELATLAEAAHARVPALDEGTLIRVVDRVEVGGTVGRRGAHAQLVAVLDGGAFAQVGGARRNR